jgi:aspartate racemase
MQGRFYMDVFSQQGISIMVPEMEDQEYIHSKYMSELVAGIFLPETRDRMLVIANRLQERDKIDGLVLGGTELPLLLHDVGESAIPFLDTTKIHVESAVAQMLS